MIIVIVVRRFCSVAKPLTKPLAKPLTKPLVEPVIIRSDRKCIHCNHFDVAPNSSACKLFTDQFNHAVPASVARNHKQLCGLHGDYYEPKYSLIHDVMMIGSVFGLIVGSTVATGVAYLLLTGDMPMRDTPMRDTPMRETPRKKNW